MEVSAIFSGSNNPSCSMPRVSRTLLEPFGTQHLAEGVGAIHGAIEAPVTELDVTELRIVGVALALGQRDAHGVIHFNCKAFRGEPFFARSSR